ncbi:hypothetical protein BCR39DRAFT_521933 [Naematelia encephala]|uniref:Uncharacterized protein n=1 Tax=Naematelia encephala TaxID=71784 RepID=A0A1Y2BDP9_9TREE|nr:hypothetical protein BCR39DRAFT_521933 [Naematelia encephala]
MFLIHLPLWEGRRAQHTSRRRSFRRLSFFHSFLPHFLSFCLSLLLLPSTSKLVLPVLSSSLLAAFHT